MWYSYQTFVPRKNDHEPDYLSPRYNYQAHYYWLYARSLSTATIAEVRGFTIDYSLNPKIVHIDAKSFLYCPRFSYDRSTMSIALDEKSILMRKKLRIQFRKFFD